MTLSPEARRRARILLARRLGLDFRNGREADLERGLLRACHGAPARDPDAYVGWLATLPDESPEWWRLAGHLTVGETYFFRDRACMEALEETILPSLIAARRAAGVRRLWLWSAGCATGEEPYSLAILLDRLLPDRADWAVTLLATDINIEALERARRGCYGAWSLRETPAWARERYFRRRGVERWELDPAIREMVTFAPLNLAEASYPAPVTNTVAMDLILCRNVVMYFTGEVQRETAARLGRALVTGGWLGVGAAEASAELVRPLIPVNFPGAIFFRKETPSVAAPSRSSSLRSIAPAMAASVWTETPVAPPSRAPQDRIEPLEDPATDAASELAKARSLADQGDLDGALVRCAGVLERDCLDFGAHLLLAEIYLERGDVPAALDALRRAVYLLPDSAPANFLLGTLLMRQGKSAAGRRCLETVVRLLATEPPDHVIAWSDGLTAGRLLETARAYLDSAR